MEERREGPVVADNRGAFAVVAAPEGPEDVCGPAPRFPGGGVEGVEVALVQRRMTRRKESRGKGREEEESGGLRNRREKETH